jgi:hypothetical protein
MTKLLEEAWAVISQLPEQQQDAIAQCGRSPIASLILKEIASERECRKAFAKSEDKLAQLADEALAEFREGKTKPLEF